jgi:CMP-N-acetylneuraminic acid synthetase
MNYIAVIPARGGSKRLPGKNIRFFGSYPLIYYSIKYALNCPMISKVYVSTDDDEISNLSMSYGAEIIRRPDELSTDTATTTSVLIHVLNELAKKKIKVDGVVTLQATNPLRTKDLIIDGLNLFEANFNLIDSVVSVSENKHKLGEIVNGFFHPTLYKREQRSQDLRKYFYENGLLYISKTSVLLEQESIFGEKVLPIVSNSLFSSIDIDTIEDFELGQMLFEKYKKTFDYCFNK